MLLRSIPEKREHRLSILLREYYATYYQQVGHHENRKATGSLVRCGAFKIGDAGNIIERTQT